MAGKRLFRRIWKSPQATGLRRSLSWRRWFRLATATRRMLPDYIIAGTQKGGTTSLHDYLARHPQVVVSSVKEVHYFDLHYARGVNWYRSHFPVATETNKRKLCAESTPYYMFCPHSPRRISQLLPTAKIVLLLRNPIERAFSHYHHEKRLGRESLSFEEAITAEPERLAGERERVVADQRYNSRSLRHHSYVERGKYVDQIAALRNYFPRKQLLILQSEELFRSTPAVFDRVLDFLGLDRWHPEEFKNLTNGRYESKIPPPTREKLSAIYAPYNARLFEELGERFDWK